MKRTEHAMRLDDRARTRTRVRLRRFLLSTTILTGALAPIGAVPLRAQTLWSGAVSDNWFTAGNWNPAVVPGAATSVQINTVTPNATVVGAAGAQASQLTLGEAPGQTGNLTVTGAGSTLGMMNAAGLFLVGNFGAGQLTVSGGATLGTFTTSLGNNAGSAGTATVTGASSVWNVNPIFAFHVGSSSTGTLNILNGGRVASAGGLDIGGDVGGDGTVLASGTGSQLALTGTGNVGLASQGALTVDAAAAMTAGTLNVGSAGAGTATFAGAGTTLGVTSTLRVGFNGGGIGTMNVQSGAVATSSTGLIGVNTGATGTANVTGVNSRWTMTGALTIGQAANSGSGTLNVLSGGRVDAQSFTGHNAATVNLDGAGSQLNLLGFSAAATTFTLGGSGADNRLDLTGGADLATQQANLSTVAGTGVTANIAGAGTTWNATGMTLGGAGTAAMTVGSNAVVSVDGDFIVDGTGTAALTVDGGRVTQSAGMAGAGQFRLGVDNHGTLLVQNGGILDSLEAPGLTGFAFLAREQGSSATATVTGTGSTWNSEGLVIVGNRGTATLDIVSGGSVTGNGTARLGFVPGSSGTALVSGPDSSWIITPPPGLFPFAPILVGIGGTGILRIEDGAYVAAGGLGVGSSFSDFLTNTRTPGQGSLVVTGPGTRVDLNVQSFQSFDAGGDGGTGIIEVLDGAVVTVVGQGHFGASAIFTGETPQQLLGHGTLTVDGAGSRVTYTQTLDIGEQATGVLNIRDGGFVSNSDGYLGSFTNAVGSAGTGTATVTGPDSTWQNSGFLRVGDQGTGTLGVLDGGLVTNTDAVIANATNSVGTATVTGAGSTWQNSGFLRVGDQGTATLHVLDGGHVTNTDAVIANATNSIGTATVAGAGSTWSSSGSLTVGNLGTATLSLLDGGVVNATGPVTVNPLSAINIGSGGAAGTLNAPSVANDGLIRFNHTGTHAFVPTISGAGAVVKDGSGTTVLDGFHSFTGATTVNAGALVVNGSIASSSALTIASGALVGGIGTLPSTSVNGGGTLSPGNSIGVINIDGNLVLGAGAIYRVEVSPAAADRANVSGTATLAGTAQIVFAPGAYTSNSYTILSAAGGRSGTFDTVTHEGLPATLSASLAYTSTDVLLVTLTSQIAPTLPTAPQPGPLAGATPNQIAVATAQDTAFNIGLPNISALYGLSLGQLPAALDALSGEVHASAAGVLVDESRYVRSAVLGRLRQASYGGEAQMASLSHGGPTAFADGELDSAFAYDKSPVAKTPLRAPQASSDIVFWAQGFGAWGRFDGDGNATSLRRDLGGFITGLDTRVGSNGRAGIAAGYTGSKNALDGRGSANVETAHVAAYGGWNFGALNLRAGGAYALHNIDTDRTILFQGFADRATARLDGGTGQVFGELGYGFAFGKVAVEPFAGGAWVRLDADAAAERGGAAALNLAANRFEVGYSTLGLRAASIIPLAQNMMLIPRASLAWQHAFDDVTPAARLAFQSSGVAFAIAGVPIARDSLLAEAGLDLAIGSHATLGVSYTGQIARNVHDHAAKGKFSWKF